MSEYPECDKLSNVKDESQIIGEFLDWCNSQGVHLATYYEERGLVADRRSIEQVLADYFDIDLDKVEEERRHILEMQQERNRSYELLEVLS
ncbi:MAG: hypothetical protein DRP83_00560 [Planctomycetota bacterium]|nr:MAG: hypothetical protein DRP83_00560 [Planctomycetota bacterium]